MEPAPSSGKTDHILLALLETNEVELPAALDKVLGVEAEPVIIKILRYRMQDSLNLSARKNDLEDVHGEVVLLVLKRLQDFLRNPEEKAIGDFCKYVAVVTHNACNDYFREKYPERSRLKNRLRYLLTHHAAFAVWESKDQEWLGGLTQWRGKNTPIRTEKFHQLQNNPASWERSAILKAELAQFVKELFLYLDHPLLLDDLVSVSSVLLGIQERFPQSDPAELERLTVPTEETTSVEDHEHYLKRLWKEIQELSMNQRKALLLNLRDSSGVNVVPLFSQAGVAGIREIASVLDMSDIDFARLWKLLPLEDTKIAAFLNLTRQQVINLRKSARERLARRMKAFEQRLKLYAK